mgnify:CR=1 FL=1
MSVIKQLNPKTYEFKYNEEKFKNAGLDNKTQMGFTAQEIEQVIPELVSTGSDDMHTKAVDYVGIIPVLIKAMQEQQVQIEEEKAHNLLLLQKVNALEERIKKLEELLLK